MKRQAKTQKQTLYEMLEEKVYSYPTTYKEGFIAAEINDLLKEFPTIDMEKYNDAMMGNTCMVRDGQTIIYHCDVLKALQCGIEKRNLKWYEWD